MKLDLPRSSQGANHPFRSRCTPNSTSTHPSHTITPNCTYLALRSMLTSLWSPASISIHKFNRGHLVCSNITKILYSPSLSEARCLNFHCCLNLKHWNYTQCHQGEEIWRPLWQKAPASQDLGAWYSLCFCLILEILGAFSSKQKLSLEHCKPEVLTLSRDPTILIHSTPKTLSKLNQEPFARFKTSKQVLAV